VKWTDDPTRYLTAQLPDEQALPSAHTVPPPSPVSVVVTVANGVSPAVNVTVTSASAVIVKLHVLSAQEAAGPVPAERRPG
jgi:hypothetical protein